MAGRVGTLGSLIASALFAVGCTVGGGGLIGGPDDDEMMPTDPDNPDNPDDPEIIEDYSLTVAPDTQTMTLGTSTEMTVTIASENYTGAVTLSAQNLPARWEAAFTPSPVVTLDPNAPTTVTLTITVPTDVAAGTVSLAIVADGDLGPRTAAAGVELENLLLIPIDRGTADGQHPFSAVQLKLGATVRFVNYDTELHRIHAGDDDAGFSHEPSPGMAPSEAEGLPGGAYTVDVTRAGEFAFYCHEHQQSSGIGALVVTDVATQ